MAQTSSVRRLALVIGSLCLLVACSVRSGGGGVAFEAPPSTDGKGAIVLNGDRTLVRWSDGDSFKFKSGPYEGSGVRLTGFNTLESYGPVHRWGSWTGPDLFAIASTSKDVGAAGVWKCTTAGERDGYGRVLVDCPGVAAEMVRAGHAHVFSMDGPGPDDLLRLQKRAQRRGVGIWAGGVPELIVTSLHSADEDEAYNRRVDTSTGLSKVRKHRDRYSVCEEVCEGPQEAPSCMLYVPYAQRYRDKPDCLR